MQITSFCSELDGALEGKKLLINKMKVLVLIVAAFVAVNVRF